MNFALHPLESRDVEAPAGSDRIVNHLPPRVSAQVNDEGLPYGADLPHWLPRILIFVLGLAWGGITAFSMAVEDMETKIQAIGLLIACVLGFVTFRNGSLLAWLNSKAGLLLATHVGAALVSGLMSDGPLESIIRYAALVPAFSLLLSVANGGAFATEIIRLGLTMAGVIFVGFHLSELDFGSITDPMYRITVFLNANSTAFIASMTGLSALEFGLRPRSRTWLRILWLGVVICCLAVLLGTKSRTAFLAMSAGVLGFAWVRFRTLWARAAIIGVIALGTAYAIHHREAIIYTMSLDQKDRSVETGTGRYEIWHYLLSAVIPENPWLGVGPGQHNDLVVYATGSSSAHNALLASLSETGVIGTLPLLLLILVCMVAAWRRRTTTGQAWATALFAAGIVESLGESVLFSIGNPASLLFMLAVATLVTPSEVPTVTVDETGSTLATGYSIHREA